MIPMLAASPHTEPHAGGVADEYDALVGHNIREIRRASGMTQADLVADLAARGLSLRQQTIVKIEAGTRPLRLREAQLIAESFRVDVNTLTPATIAEAAALIRATRKVEDARLAIGRAVGELEVRQQALSDLLAHGSHVGSQAPLSAVEAAELATAELETKRALHAVGEAASEVVFPRSGS